jgi:hypothetical protein
MFTAMKTSQKSNLFRGFQSANEMYRLKCRSLSAKLLPPFAGRGYHTVSATGPCPLISISYNDISSNSQYECF